MIKNQFTFVQWLSEIVTIYKTTKKLQDNKKDGKLNKNK